MREFALTYNQLGNRLQDFSFLKDNFDFVPFRRDVENFNDYELIYVYTTSGARKELHGGYCKWWEYPKYLRQNGVREPKILFQIDSNGYTFNEFPCPEVLPYIDGVLHVGYRDWELPIPSFYVQYPLSHPPNPRKRWVPFKDKRKEAVLVRRHDSMYMDSRYVAGKIGIRHNSLGGNTYKRHGDEYWDYLAEHVIGLDYHLAYFSWSRFVAECAYMGTPVLAPNTIRAATIANRKLVCDRNKCVKIGKKLLSNEDFYEESRETSFKNISEYLSEGACTERYRSIFKAIGVRL